MPSHRRFSVLIAGTLLLLSGCVTTSDSWEESYHPPAAGEPAAFLKGSQISEGGLFGNDRTGFVAMIDLKPVRDARDNWGETIALTPGKHTIVGEYRYSNFMARAYLPLEAKAGVTYQLMIKDGHDETAEARLYSDFWIVDRATGNLVTPVYRRQVSGGKRATLFRGNQ